MNKQTSTANSCAGNTEGKDKFKKNSNSSQLNLSEKMTKDLLVWLDKTIDDKSNILKYNMTELQRVINNIGTFTDSDEFIKFIQAVNHEKIFVVASGALGKDVVPKIHDMYHIDSIFIFCGNLDYHKQWAKSWSKIHGVFTELGPLCESIEQAKKQNERNTISVQFLSMKENLNVKNLDQLHCSFMYTQILKEILLSIEFILQNFQDFIDYCREIFFDNNRELKNIEEFQRNYHQRTPIYWYTCDYFLYRMLNHALRTMNVEIIIKMGFFINDLHNHIASLHSKQFSYHRPNSSFTVYRGQSLSKSDFDQLKTTLGGLMSFNNFLSTSKNRLVSYDFAVADSLRHSDVIGVLFVMKIDPSVSSAPFASITDVSYYKAEEDEVLFSMHTVFRTHSIQPMSGNDRVFQVNLILTSDDDKDLCRLTEHIGQEIKGPTGWYRLSVFLLKLGHTQKAQEVYEMMHNYDVDLKEREQLRGLITSISNQPKSNDMIQTNSHEDLSVIQQSLHVSGSEEIETCIKSGTTMYNMDQYEKALPYFEKALRIQQELLPPNHPDFAMSYINIGNVYNKTSRCIKALSYLEKALKIQEKSLPSNHPDLGTTLNHIGEVYRQMQNYTSAYSFFRRAVEIGENSLPPNDTNFRKWKNNFEQIQKNSNMFVLVSKIEQE